MASRFGKSEVMIFDLGGRGSVEMISILQLEENSEHGHYILPLSNNTALLTQAVYKSRIKLVDTRISKCPVRVESVGQRLAHGVIAGCSAFFVSPDKSGNNDILTFKQLQCPGIVAGSAWIISTRRLACIFNVYAFGNLVVRLFDIVEGHVYAIVNPRILHYTLLRVVAGKSVARDAPGYICGQPVLVEVLQL